MRRGRLSRDRQAVAAKVQNISICRTRTLNIEEEMETVEAIQHQEDQKFDAFVSTEEESDGQQGIMKRPSMDVMTRILPRFAWKLLLRLRQGL